MGFNSTVVICNDALGDIENDHNFGKKISEGIAALFVKKDISITAEGKGIHIGAAVVVETHHADSVVLVAVGGNTARNLGYVGGYTMLDDKIAILRAFAADCGYTLTKKRKRKWQ